MLRSSTPTLTVGFSGHETERVRFRSVSLWLSGPAEKVRWSADFERERGCNARRTQNPFSGHPSAVCELRGRHRSDLTVEVR